MLATVAKECSRSEYGTQRSVDLAPCKSPTASVRQATPADIQVIWEHCRALALHHHALPSFHLTLLSLSLAFDRGAISGLVAMTGHSVAGSALYSDTYSTWSGRSNLYLEHLYVDPAFRDQGHGRALLERLRSQVDGRIEFSVEATNDRSLKFYEAAGAKVHRGWLQMRLPGAVSTAGDHANRSEKEP